jgi:hypothetical protein
MPAPPSSKFSLWMVPGSATGVPPNGVFTIVARYLMFSLLIRHIVLR